MKNSFPRQWQAIAQWVASQKKFKSFQSTFLGIEVWEEAHNMKRLESEVLIKKPFHDELEALSESLILTEQPNELCVRAND